MSNRQLLSPNLKFFLLIVLLFVCWLIGRYIPFDIEFYKQFLAQYPLALSGLIFVVAYVIMTFFVWFSKDLFRLAAAILFGAYWSTLFVWIAEMINLVILFHISRNLGREFVEQKFKLKPVVTADDGHYFWRVFALRIVPIIAFKFLDLGFGLTKISFRKYFISLIASPLRIFWVQFILAGVGDALFKDPLAMF